jgi:teichuronic acid biosynthesis glycosyltransferase TuaC
MNVLMIHVGNEINTESIHANLQLSRLDLITRLYKTYSKHDIINADTQMQSLIKEGVQLHYGHFSQRKSIVKTIAAAKQIRKLCKEHQIDIVHSMWGTTTALLCTLVSPKPVVVSFCGSDLLGTYNTNGKNKLSSYVNILCSQLAAFLSAKIICKSEVLKSKLWNINKRKAEVIPNGVDLEQFKPINQSEARLKLGIKHSNPMVLFFSGNNQIVKNKPLAMASLFELKKTLPQAELLEAINISHNDIHLYYNACDVLLLTSFHEGSNNSVKEAIACGLPIVTVNVGDVSERLKNVNQSIIVPAYDEKQIANSLYQILLKRERSNGFVVAQEFSLETIAKKIISIYKQILNNDSHR